MSRQLNNPNTRRDYGATASSSSTTQQQQQQLPDVNFSGFSPTEFMSLSEDIALNITSISSSWKQLEKFSKLIGTPKDQQNTRDRIHNINATTNQRIEETSKALQRLTPIGKFFKSDFSKRNLSVMCVSNRLQLPFKWVVKKLNLAS